MYVRMTKQSRELPANQSNVLPLNGLAKMMVSGVVKDEGVEVINLKDDALQLPLISGYDELSELELSDLIVGRLTAHYFGDQIQAAVDNIFNSKDVLVKSSLIDTLVISINNSKCDEAMDILNLEAITKVRFTDDDDELDVSTDKLRFIAIKLAILNVGDVIMESLYQYLSSADGLNVNELNAIIDGGYLDEEMLTLGLTVKVVDGEPVVSRIDQTDTEVCTGLRDEINDHAERIAVDLCSVYDVTKSQYHKLIVDSIHNYWLNGGRLSASDMEAEIAEERSGVVMGELGLGVNADSWPGSNKSIISDGLINHDAPVEESNSTVEGLRSESEVIKDLANDLASYYGVRVKEHRDTIHNAIIDYLSGDGELNDADLNDLIKSGHGAIAMDTIGLNITLAGGIPAVFVADKAGINIEDIQAVGVKLAEYYGVRNPEYLKLIQVMLVDYLWLGGAVSRFNAIKSKIVSGEVDSVMRALGLATATDTNLNNNKTIITVANKDVAADLHLSRVSEDDMNLVAKSTD